MLCCGRKEENLYPFIHIFTHLFYLPLRMYVRMYVHYNDRGKTNTPFSFSSRGNHWFIGLVAVQATRPLSAQQEGHSLIASSCATLQRCPGSLPIGQGLVNPHLCVRRLCVIILRIAKPSSQQSKWPAD
jgi:hypothetical protein